LRPLKANPHEELLERLMELHCGMTRERRAALVDVLEGIASDGDVRPGVRVEAVLGVVEWDKVVLGGCREMKDLALAAAGMQQQQQAPMDAAEDRKLLALALAAEMKDEDGGADRGASGGVAGFAGAGAEDRAGESNIAGPPLAPTGTDDARGRPLATNDPQGPPVQLAHLRIASERQVNGRRVQGGLGGADRGEVRARGVPF
jgi:hypothetical protein